MDKLAVSGVDTHVGNAAGVCIGEEDDVAFLKVGFFHRRTLTVLIGGGAVGGDAHLLKYIIDKAGAVKSIRGSAAAAVGNTQILLCLCQNLTAVYAGSAGAGRCAAIEG